MKNLLFLILLSSCSHVLRPTHEGMDQDLPKWVYSAYDFCTETNELCASGEGPSFSSSDNDARSNLASIFKVQINSTFSSTITEEKSLHQMEMKVKGQALQTLQSSVDEVLEAVVITHRSKQNNVHYSLARLDRMTATNILNQRLAKIDDELNAYWKKQQRTLVRKMLKLSTERTAIEEKLSILTPVYAPAPVSYGQIIDWALAVKNRRPVSLKVGHAPKWLSSKVSSLLNEVGYNIIGMSNDHISVNLTLIKEFLNVEGFEKYTITMTLQNIKNGERIGHLSNTETVIGRNQDDALLKVKNSFSDYLEDHLYILNLD